VTRLPLPPIRIVDHFEPKEEAAIVARLFVEARRGDWRVAAFLLDRQFPERWSPRARGGGRAV